MKVIQPCMSIPLVMQCYKQKATNYGIIFNLPQIFSKSILNGDISLSISKL